MSPSAPIDDDRVHRIESGGSKRARLGWVLGLVALAGVAAVGIWVAVARPLQGGVVVEAPPAAAGNLLGEDWSFEDGLHGWDLPDGAPAGFVAVSQGASSGAGAARATPGEAGWARLISAPKSLGLHRGDVAIAAEVSAGRAQLFVRFEAPDRAQVDVPVASGTGAISGTASVPGGFTTVRAGVTALEDASVDDLDLRLVPGNGGVSSSGGFELVQLDPGVLVLRGDVPVFEVLPPTLVLGDEDGLPSGVGWMPDLPGLALPGGGQVELSSSFEQDGPRLVLEQIPRGVPDGARMRRVLRVTGPLAERPVGVATGTGFEHFTEQMAVGDARWLALGRTRDRLVFDLGGSVALSGSRQADGSMLLLVERPVADGQAIRVALQTSFQDERVAAVLHRDAAREHERAGRLGAALAELDVVLRDFPFDDDVVAESGRQRAMLVTSMQAEIDRIDADLEDALFLASASRCREVLDECTRLAGVWSGSEAAARFEERGERVHERARDLLEADLARRAGRLDAVAGSFETFGGYDQLATEIRDTLTRFYGGAVPAEARPAEARPAEDGQP